MSLDMTVRILFFILHGAALIFVMLGLLIISTSPGHADRGLGIMFMGLAWAAFTAVRLLLSATP